MGGLKDSNDIPFFQESDWARLRFGVDMPHVTKATTLIIYVHAEDLITNKEGHIRVIENVSRCLTHLSMKHSEGLGLMQRY